MAEEVHKGQTIVTPSMKENLCNSNHCREELYDPRCFRCYTVRTKCPTCKTEHTFPPKDPDRADMFVKVVPLESWECPDCSEKRVNSTRIDKQEQNPDEDPEYISQVRCKNCNKHSIQEYGPGMEFKPCPHCGYAVGIREKPVEKQSTLEGLF